MIEAILFDFNGVIIDDEPLHQKAYFEVLSAHGIEQTSEEYYGSLGMEDEPPGIESARAARMRTLGVTNTISEEALRRAGADVVTHSLADWTVDAIHHVFSEG